MPHREKYNIPKFETISDLADFLDAMPASDPDAKIGLDMARTAYYRGNNPAHPCGTACCIGGFVAISIGRCYRYPDRAFMVAFDVDLSESYAICNPPVYHDGWKATPQQAASLLRHYVETGEVDWDRATCVKKETADA